MRFSLGTRRRVAGCASILGAAVVVGWAASEEAPSTSLEELFRASSYTVETSAGKLTGAGAEFLARESRDVQFFCIGEPHNVREIPRFVTALFESLQERHGFHYLAIEQGPLITRHIGRLAQSEDQSHIRKTVKKRRKALHFRTVEEVEMIADAARASRGGIAGVWGLDRVLDASYLRKYLASPEGSADQEAGFLQGRGEWSAKNLSMYDAPRGSPDWLAADQHREDGFKTGFQHYYGRATAEDGRPPRVLFRFGHVHMGRSGDDDGGSLGHYLSRFARDNGLETFHLNIQLINRPGRYWSLTQYPEYEPLAKAGDPERWILVDLRPARAALLAGEFTSHARLLRLAVDFDAVLLMGGASKGRKL